MRGRPPCTWARFCAPGSIFAPGLALQTIQHKERVQARSAAGTGPDCSLRDPATVPASPGVVDMPQARACLAWVNGGSPPADPDGASVVRQLCPPKIRRSVEGCLAPCRSRKEVVKRLTADAVRYAIRQRKKGKGSSTIASEPGVTSRHVRRLWAGFCRTDTSHVPRRPGRKPV